MTIAEFLTALRLHAPAHRWMLGTIALAPLQRGIRTEAPRSERQCPITFVGQKPRLHQTSCAGQALGLSRADIDQIVRAADEVPGHDPALRQALRDAVGLTEDIPCVP